MFCTKQPFVLGKTTVCFLKFVPMFFNEHTYKQNKNSATAILMKRKSANNQYDK